MESNIDTKFLKPKWKCYLKSCFLIIQTISNRSIKYHFYIFSSPTLWSCIIIALIRLIRKLHSSPDPKLMTQNTTMKQEALINMIMRKEILPLLRVDLFSYVGRDFNHPISLEFPPCPVKTTPLKNIGRLRMQVAYAIYASGSFGGEWTNVTRREKETRPKGWVEMGRGKNKPNGMCVFVCVGEEETYENNRVCGQDWRMGLESSEEDIVRSIDRIKGVM